MGHPTMQENDTAKLTPTLERDFKDDCLMNKSEKYERNI